MVDLRLGVAAVKHSMLYDADANGDTRTGLLGCRRCLDTLQGMQIICASVPFALEVAEDVHDYNASTIHHITFAPAQAARHMVCGATHVRVSTLRSSKKRHSQAVAPCALAVGDVAVVPAQQAAVGRRRAQARGVVAGSARDARLVARRRLVLAVVRAVFDDTAANRNIR